MATALLKEARLKMEDRFIAAEAKKRILIVDDDKGLNVLIQKAMERIGLESKGVLTGQAAVDTVLNDTIDLILLDYQLSGMTGEQVIDELELLHEKVPFIVVTGHGDEKIAVKMMKKGARDYIVKTPDFVDSLPRLVIRVLNEIELEMQLKTTKKELQRMVLEWQQTFNSISDFVSVQDEKFRILKVNKALADYLGKKPEELIGKPCYQVIHNLNHPIENCPMMKTKEFLKASTQEINDPNIGCPLMITTSPRFDKDGIFKGTVHIARDLTNTKIADQERIKLETQLQQAKKMESIGLLAGGIAHDFNNILYPIIGFTQLSQSELSKGHPVQENLKDILDGAIRARDLVKRILLLSRQKEPEAKPTILQPVIKETHKMLRSTIPSNIDIELDLYDGQDAVLCNDSEIHEIILNLCTNSYHAISGDRGEIVISLEKKKAPQLLDLPQCEYLCLAIKDDGVGIPDKIKDTIFDPYVTTKGIGKGSGLGLSVVYGIVQNYNGGINFESSPETGTVFEIYLPTTDKSTVIEDDVSIKDPAIIGNERILFVDDEDSIVKLGVRILENSGYQVTGINDSSRALELFKADSDEFDLVITDMAMPNMTGIELSKKILKIRPDIPILICSGYSERLDMEKAKDLRVSALLNKPLYVDNLVKITRKVLDKNKTK